MAEIREGKSKVGTILYNYDGVELRKGRSKVGSAIFNCDGEISILILIAAGLIE